MSLFERLRGHLTYHALLLGGLALVAGALLAGGSEITMDTIAQREADDLQSSLSQVVPDDLHDNDLLTDTLLIREQTRATKVFRGTEQGQVAAVAFRSEAYGYASTPISIIMGIDRNGKILGVRVLAHAETPGLGDKIEEKKSNWIFAFNGKSLRDPGDKGWAVKKDGGIFDQFTGATITPRGVVRAVHAGLDFFARHRNELLAVANANGARPKRKRDE